MATFPNEKPCTPHDLIDLAEANIFSGFDDALSASGSTQTRRDFDFTECNRATGNDGIVIARPKSGQGDHWAVEEGDGEWHQRPDYDASTQGLDTSKCPQPQPPPAPNAGPQVGAPIFSGSYGGSSIRMTGSPQDKVPDVGNLGKGDGKEFERKLDAMFADLDPEK